MQNLKRRLDNLENSGANGKGTHEEFVLWSMAHGFDDAALIAVTNDDTDAFLRGKSNLEESNHATP